MIAYHMRYTSQNRLFLNALRPDATLCRLKQLIISSTRSLLVEHCSPTFFCGWQGHAETMSYFAGVGNWVLEIIRCD